MSDPSGFMPTWAKWAIGVAAVAVAVAVAIIALPVEVVAAVGTAVVTAATAVATVVSRAGPAVQNVIQRAGPGVTRASNLASNATNSAKLKAQLTYEEAKSVFTPDGLHPDVIKNSRAIVQGIKLENKEVIKALTSDGSSIGSWAKMSTQVFKSPSGPFQVHYGMRAFRVGFKPSWGQYQANFQQNMSNERTGQVI